MDEKKKYKEAQEHYNEILSACHENTIPGKQLTPLDISWTFPANWTEWYREWHGGLNVMTTGIQSLKNELDNECGVGDLDDNEMEQFTPDDTDWYPTGFRKRQRT